MSRSIQAISILSTELDQFLQSSEVRSFYLAQSTQPPPPLSFIVPFPRLSLTLQGTDEMEIDSGGARTIISSKPGDVIFVPANSWNRPTWTQRVKVMHFLFGPKHCGISLVQHEGGGKQPHTAVKASLPASGGTVKEILAAITLLPIEHPVEEVGPHLAKALLLCLAHELRRQSSVKVRKARNTYEKICLYLQEHFHQSITRESVAAQFQLNPNHLSRLFRREGLMRFTDYLAWVRVDRAKYLLKNHDLTLDDLAQRCGFQDTSYFCRVFKQRTNQTPVGYRMESRTPRRQEEIVRMTAPSVR